MMTRVSFCPKCHAAGRPKTNDMFVVFGSNRQTYRVYHALKHGRRGFVPHIYDLKRVVGAETVYYDVACSMVGCGAIAEPEKNNSCQYKVGFYWDNSSMPLNEWNGLVRYKRDPDFEI